MSDLVTRLRASVRMGANDGNGVERMVCGKQMLEAADEIERLRAELAEAHQREELFWTPLLKHTEKVEAECDAIRELLRDAREACLRWLSNGAPRSIPVRENDADVLLAAIDAALAQVDEVDR